MNEDFVSFELAKKLKEKGFNKPCYGWYYPSEVCGFDYKNTIVFNHSDYRGSNYKDMLVSHNDDKHIDTPTISQALKWLREEKEIHVSIEPITRELRCFWYYSVKFIKQNRIAGDIHLYDSFEQAALAGVVYTLDNLI